MMQIPSWLTKTVSAIVAGVTLLFAWFAVQRYKQVKEAKNTQEYEADYIERNAHRIENASEEALVARTVAKAHAAKAEAIKVKTIKSLNELEATRGTKTAADLADKLNSL